jgi:hypothetical protein
MVQRQERHGGPDADPRRALGDHTTMSWLDSIENAIAP